MEKLYSIYLQHPTITTDSRVCPEGSIFFALKGENFNGNKFAPSALDKGCAYAVIDEPDLIENIDERYVVVDDVLTTLQNLARFHRNLLTIPIIGVTGTNGKTTTKELIAAVLSKKYKVHYTQGNFNNHIGVPLTILSIPRDCQIAVIEMGANHPGEIRFLTSISQPTCGIITNVGKAHLEGFGSLEGVICTKRALYRSVASRNGHVFINAANEYLVEALDGYKPCTSYSSDPYVKGDVNGKLIKCAPFVEFKLYGEKLHTVQTHFVGAYNLDNMLAAITIGLHFGVSEDDAVAAIAEYIPNNNRSQLTKTERNTLIVDAYNANPTSMTAAIENFDIIEGDGKVAFIGDMLELGSQSLSEHKNIILRLKDSKIQKLILVGREFYRAYNELGINMPMETVLIENPTDVMNFPFNELNGKIILIKGSHGIGLHKLIPFL